MKINNDIIKHVVYCVTLMKRMKTIYVQKIDPNDQPTHTFIRKQSSLKCSIGTHKNAKAQALKKIYKIYK